MDWAFIVLLGSFLLEPLLGTTLYLAALTMEKHNKGIHLHPTVNFVNNCISISIPSRTI